MKKLRKNEKSLKSWKTFEKHRKIYEKIAKSCEFHKKLP